MCKKIVKVDKVSVNFDSTKAIDNVSFDINAGEVLALLGENGAGKSTLINSILGRLKIDKGCIRIFDVAPGEQRAKQRTGTILQSANLPDTSTVEEQITLFSSYYPAPLAKPDLIKLTMLEGLEKRRINTLSGGQKQRLFFALAVCGNPQIIFLDEPTVGLDSSARREFWQCIESLKLNGVSVVLTTHYLEEAEALADRIILLKQGTIIHQGTPSEVKTKALGKRVNFVLHSPKAMFETCLSQLQQQSLNVAISNLVYNQDKVSLTCARPEPLLESLFTQGVGISDLTIESARLEDAVEVLNRQINSTQLVSEEAA
ncbi:ABC transporter ATP-binding protein [Planctobacterium marinum]|uniref:ABC transporter ATP-binding protein n=1 Tax=Planctobacterium marinum TaxID=1631968 RepID=A0AA48I4B3_9ALTE|nr:ABC transporter ATP-binding protein [Planctobacterium marinum]